MQAMGIPFQSPLAHVREYVRIVKGFLQHSQIDVEGIHSQAHETIPEPPDVPVMASALQRRSSELCEAEADGAISWICPGPYLRDVALPAMREGAAHRRLPSAAAHRPRARLCA
jgi:alkanesulfonate monooxygenase SsuD/methylene tetrahydromethanopterin reductase-like flavin-dependent oxidoreductase (luciferase family)